MDVKQLNIKAVLIGFAVDFFGSMIAALVFGMVYGGLLASRGMGVAQITETMTHAPAVLAASLVFGLLFTALGGYLAARIDGGGDAINPLAVGAVSTGLGVLTLLFTKEHGPLWYNAAAFVLTLPCALLGGWLHHRR